MIHYNQWDIVLVPFPFTNLSATKKRPGLIVSPLEYHLTNDFVIAFVTSNIKSESKFGDYLIKNWKEANLPKPSMIRMKFATITGTLVVKKLGSLKEPDLTDFNKELLKFLKNNFKLDNEYSCLIWIILK